LLKFSGIGGLFGEVGIKDDSIVGSASKPDIPDFTF
jgi:hypothetical protein